MDELARLRRQTEELLSERLPPPIPPAAAPAYGEALLEPVAVPLLATGLGPLVAPDDEPEEPDDAVAEAAVAWHIEQRRQVLNHARVGAELQALRCTPLRAGSIGTFSTARREALAQRIAGLDAELEGLAGSQKDGTLPGTLDDLEAALSSRLRSDELLCEWRQWAANMANVHRTHGLALLHRAAVDPAASAPAPGWAADECCLPTALTTETEVEAALDALAVELGMEPLGPMRPSRYRACTSYFENLFESTQARLRAPALEGLTDAAAATARAKVDRLLAVRDEQVAAAEAKAAGVAELIAKTAEDELAQRLRWAPMPRGSQAEYTDGLGVTHHAILVGGTDRAPRIEYEEPSTRRTKAHEVRRQALLPLGGREQLREASGATQRAVDRRAVAEGAVVAARDRLAKVDSLIKAVAAGAALAIGRKRLSRPGEPAPEPGGGSRLAAAVRMAVAAEAGSLDVVMRPSGWLRHAGVFALGGEEGCLQRAWIKRQPNGGGAARLVLASIREQDFRSVVTRVAASAREAARELAAAAGEVLPAGSPRRVVPGGNAAGGGGGGACGSASGGEAASAVVNGSRAAHSAASPGTPGGTGWLRVVAPSQEALQALALLRLARMRSIVDELRGALNWSRAVERRVACQTQLLASRARGERADAPPGPTASAAGGDGDVPLGAWADGLFGYWQSVPALARMEDDISPFPSADLPPGQVWELGGGQPSATRWDDRPLLYEAAEHDLERVLNEVESRSAALLHLHMEAMAAVPHHVARPTTSGSPAKRARGSSRSGGAAGRVSQRPGTGGAHSCSSSEVGRRAGPVPRPASPTPPHGPAVASLAALGASGLAEKMIAAAAASRAAVDAPALVLRLLDQTVEFERTRRRAACCYLALLHHCVFPAHRSACVQRLAEILALRPSSAPPAEAAAAAGASASAAGAVAAMVSEVDLDGGKAAARLREAVHWQMGKGSAVQARGLQLEASILTTMLERVLSAARASREGGTDDTLAAVSARAAVADNQASRWQLAGQRVLAGLAAAAAQGPEVCAEAGELSALPVLIDGATSALMSRSLLPGFPQPPAACARASILALAMEKVDRLPTNPEVRDALTHPALRTPVLKPLLAAVRHPSARPAQGGAPAMEAVIRRRIGRAFKACAVLSRLRAEVDATERLARLDESHRHACGMPPPHRSAASQDRLPPASPAHAPLIVATDIPMLNDLGTGGGLPSSPQRSGSAPSSPGREEDPFPALPGFEPPSPEARVAGWFAGGGPAPALHATDPTLCPIAPRDPTWWKSVLADSGTAPRELRVACRLQTIHRAALDIAASSNDVATSAALSRRLDEELSRQVMVGERGAGAAVGYVALLQPPLQPEWAAALADAVVAPCVVRRGADAPAVRRRDADSSRVRAADASRPSGLVWYGQWNDETRDVLGRMLPQVWLHAGGICAPLRARVRQAFEGRVRASAVRATEACKARLKADRSVSATAAAALASAAAADAISDVLADRAFKLDLLRQYCADLAGDLAEPALRAAAAELTRALVSRAGPVLRPFGPMQIVREETSPPRGAAAEGATAASDGTTAQDGMICGRGQLRSLTRLLSDAKSVSLLKRSKLPAGTRLEALAAVGGVCGRMLQLLPLLRIRALLRPPAAAWQTAADAAAEAIHRAPDATPYSLADVPPAWEEAAGREMTELDALLAAGLPSGPGGAAAAARAAAARGTPVTLAEGPAADMEAAPAVRALGLCVGGMLLQLQLALYCASAACGKARDAAAASRGGLLEMFDEAAEELQEESQLASDARALAAALAALLSVSSPTGSAGWSRGTGTGGGGAGTCNTGGGLLVELPAGCDPGGDAAVGPLIVPLADSAPTPQWGRTAGSHSRGTVWVALPPSAALEHQAIAHGGAVDATPHFTPAAPLHDRAGVAAGNDAGGRAPGSASTSGSGVSAGAWQSVSSPRAVEPLCASRSLASALALETALGAAGAALLLVSAGTLTMVRAEHAHAGIVMERLAGRAAEAAAAGGGGSAPPLAGAAADSHFALTGLDCSDAETKAAAAMATAAMLSTGAAGEGPESASSVRTSVLGPPLFGPAAAAAFERGGGSHAPLEPVRAWVFDELWDETDQAPDAPPPMPNLGDGAPADDTEPEAGRGLPGAPGAATHDCGGSTGLAPTRPPALPSHGQVNRTSLSSVDQLKASAVSLGYEGELAATVGGFAGEDVARRGQAGPALLFAIMAEGARLELQTVALRRAARAAAGRRAPFFDAAQLDAAYDALVARRAAGATLPGALAPLAPYYAAIAYGTAWLAQEARLAELSEARDRLTRAVACRTAALEELRGAALSEHERPESEASFVEDAFTSAAGAAGAGLKIDEAFFEHELRVAQELGGALGGEVAYRAVAEALAADEAGGGEGPCVLCLEGAASKPLRARLAARLRFLLSPAGSCGCPECGLGPGGVVDPNWRGDGCGTREWPAEMQAVIDAAMMRSGLAEDETVLRKYAASAPAAFAMQDGVPGSPSEESPPASRAPPPPPSRWTPSNNQELLHLRAKNDEEILALVREAFRAGEPWRRNGGNAKAMRAAMAAAVSAVQAEGVPWGWVRRDPVFTASDSLEERHAAALRARRPPLVFDSPFGPPAAGSPPPPQLLPRMLDCKAAPELRHLEPLLDLHALAVLRSRDEPTIRVSRCSQDDPGVRDARWDAWLQRAARIDATRRVAAAERRAAVGDAETTGAWVANEVADHRLRIALEGEAIKRALAAAAAGGRALDTQVRARLVDRFRDAVAERAASRLLRQGALQEQALRLRAGLRRAAYDARRSTIVSLLESDSGIPIEGRRRALGRLAEEDRIQAVVDDNVRLQTLLSRLHVSSGLHRMRAAHTAGEEERRERAARVQEDGLRAALSGSDETREFLQRHLAASEHALRESRAELAALTHRRDTLARSNKALRRSRAAADGAGAAEEAGVSAGVSAGEACGFALAPSSPVVPGRGAPSSRGGLLTTSPRHDGQLSARTLAKSALSLDEAFSLGGGANLDAAMAVASGFASPRAERIAASAGGRAPVPACRPLTPREMIPSPRATTASSGSACRRLDPRQQSDGLAGNRLPDGDQQPDWHAMPLLPLGPAAVTARFAAAGVPGRVSHPTTLRAARPHTAATGALGAGTLPAAAESPRPGTSSARYFRTERQFSVQLVGQPASLPAFQPPPASAARPATVIGTARAETARAGSRPPGNQHGQPTVAEASKALLDARRERQAAGGRPATAAVGAGPPQPPQATVLHETLPLRVRADETLGGTARRIKEPEYKPGEAARRIASGLYNQM